MSPSKRRKTSQYLSPAKSILRTPGVPTPRKQNTNVTFKDVTPSLSPEIRRKNNPPKDGPLPQAVVSAHKVTSSTSDQIKPNVSQGTFEAPCKPNSEVQASQMLQVKEQEVLVYEFEAYRSSTEKEMKKLVRYGQKMREYARKQDEENTKLRIALERLQKQNEELRQRERRRESSRSGGNNESEVGKQESRKLVASDSSKSPTRCPPSAPIPQVYTNGANTKSTKASTVALSLAESVPKAKSQAQRQSSPLKRKASSQFVSEPPITHIARSLDQSDTQAAKKSSNQKDLQTSQAASARLAPDRLAAARERIRRKAQLRKPLEANTSSPVNWDAL